MLCGGTVECQLVGWRECFRIGGAPLLTSAMATHVDHVPAVGGECFAATSFVPSGELSYRPRVGLKPRLIQSR